jgi:hypothetical protein
VDASQPGAPGERPEPTTPHSRRPGENRWGLAVGVLLAESLIFVAMGGPLWAWMFLADTFGGGGAATALEAGSAGVALPILGALEIGLLFAGLGGAFLVLRTRPREPVGCAVPLTIFVCVAAVLAVCLPLLRSLASMAAWSRPLSWCCVFGVQLAGLFILARIQSVARQRPWQQRQADDDVSLDGPPRPMNEAARERRARAARRRRGAP